MRKRKNMTETNFKNIHLLKKAGLTINQAAIATGRAYGTVKKVYETETYGEYKTPAPAPVAVQPSNPQEDFTLLLDKLTVIETCLNQLLLVIKDKEAKANAGFWRR